MNLGVLVSGRGSNMAAIVKASADGRLSSRVAVVLSDVAEAPALALARAAGVPAEHVATASARPKLRREDSDRFVGRLRAFDVDLVVLAGFMRILGRPFFEAYPGRILNIHPSLLPDFRGLDPQRRALEAGVRVSGCTVHVVTPRVDEGPILAQASVPVLEGDTVEALSARILAEEHRVYVETIRAIERGDVSLSGGGIDGSLESSRGNA